MAITWLTTDETSHFPPVEQATDQGLLAAGGDLSADRLVDAYQQGIFPWFNQNDPILWWSPDPRMVLYTDKIKIRKSLKKTLQKKTFDVTFDTAFKEVMHACSLPRENQPTDPGNHSWIHPNIIEAYYKLHKMGLAHSIECWQNNELVGGLYGVSIGKMFFGESMFSFVADASKVALVHLCRQLQRWGVPLIDCQIYSAHLASMGAEEISRQRFNQHLHEYCHQSALPTVWQLDKDIPLL